MKWLIALAVAGLLALAAGVAVLQKVKGVPDWSVRARPVEPTGVTRTQLLGELAGEDRSAVPAKVYGDLFRYLFEGFATYRAPEGERVYFPGAPSSNGRLSDGVEGFTRFVPLASAWLASGGADEIEVAGRPVSVRATLIQGLLTGTDPANPLYWGKLKDYGQLSYETGDIATALWLSREQIWKTLEPAQRKQIATWLRQVLEVKMYPGNWSLSPLVVHASLAALGEDVHAYDQRAATAFARFRTLYRGDGWFDDPPNGFDFYNSWAIHYNLFWLSQMAPEFEADFIRKVQGEFGQFFKHMFGPNGHPIYGRSVCYRLGASAGLLTAAALAPQSVSVGEAMRALDTSTRFYVGRGAIEAGTVTQGLCGTNLSVVDEYSSQGSCQTGLRALTVAFYLEPRLRVFEADRQPLPVEVGDFKVHNATTNWTVTGSQASGQVTLTLDGNPTDAQIGVAPYSLTRRLMEFALHRPRRPDNHHAMYGSREYSTERPVLACPAVRAP